MDFYEIQANQDLRTSRFPIVKITPVFKFV